MKLSIKRKLQAYSLIILLAFIFIGVTVFTVASSTSKISNTAIQISALRTGLNEMMAAERDFVQWELGKEEFYKSDENNNPQIKKFRQKLQVNKEIIATLQSSEVIAESDATEEVGSLDGWLVEYGNLFNSLVAENKKRGMNDKGLVGDLNKSLAALEAAANSTSQQLRVSELKNAQTMYLANPSLKNRQALKNQIASLENYVTGSSRTALQGYNTIFKRLVSSDEIIGLDEAQGTFGKLNSKKIQLEPVMSKILEKTSGYLDKQTGNATLLVGIAIVGGILVSLLISIFMIRGIDKSVKSAIVSIKEIAKGNLSYNLENDRNDEIGDLLNHLKVMIDKLKDIVSTVIDSSNNIANASMELSKSSQLMSDGASEQASSAEEVSSSMEEMAANIDQNTANSKQTEQIAIAGANNIIESNHLVSKTLDSMKSITQRISIIGEISRQTNLLALNAAVEAARAGEYGKGFAVVAAEIRRLAERSQSAASEIDEESLLGVETAQASGDMLSSIVPEIQKTADLVKEITSASIEQNNGADQINSAVQNLNQIVQQNAAVAEEMAANSEELYSQAELLLEAISFFQIDGAATSSNGAAKRKEKLDKTQQPVETFESNEPIKEEKASVEQPVTDSTEQGVDIDLSGDNDVLDSDFEKY